MLKQQEIKQSPQGQSTLRAQLYWSESYNQTLQNMIKKVIDKCLYIQKV